MKKKKKKKKAVLSELDARVLRSLLDPSASEAVGIVTNATKAVKQQWDAQTRAKAEEYLDRGVKRPLKRAEELKRKRISDMSDSEFRSEIMRKLSSSKLWKAIEARAAEWFESARIYILNRIERDLKLLIALGIYATSRIKADTERLFGPGGGNAQLLMSGSLNATEAFNFDTTVGEEVLSVTTALKDILTGKSDGRPSSEGGGRGLRSLAKAGSSKTRRLERQRRAYQRRKETVFKREQERGTIQGVGRAVGDVATAAYELQREFQTEQPGQRTAAFRKAMGNTLLGGDGGDDDEGLEELRSAAVEDVMYIPDIQAKDVISVENNAPIEISSSKSFSQDPPSMDASSIQIPRVEKPSWDASQQQSNDNDDSQFFKTPIERILGMGAKKQKDDNKNKAAPTKAVEQIADEMVFIERELRIVGLLHLLHQDVNADEYIQAEVDKVKKRPVPKMDPIPHVEIPVVPEEPQLTIPDCPIPMELLDEKEAVLDRLKECIESPESTWLTSEIQAEFAQSPASSSPVGMVISIRNAVAAMVRARDELAKTIQEEEDTYEEGFIEESVEFVNALVAKLAKVKQVIEAVTSLAADAAGEKAGDSLKKYLYGEFEDIQTTTTTATGMPTLDSLETIRTEYKREVEEVTEAARRAYQTAVEYREHIIEEREAAILHRDSLIAEAKAKQDQAIAENDVWYAKARAEAMQRGVSKAEELEQKKMAAVARGREAAARNVAAKLAREQARAEAEARRRQRELERAQARERDGGQWNNEGLPFGESIASYKIALQDVLVPKSQKRKSSSSQSPMTSKTIGNNQQQRPMDAVVEDKSFWESALGTLEDSTRAVAAELVSDQEFADEHGIKSGEEGEYKRNVVVDLTLRTLDVGMLALEKVVAMGPGVGKAINMVTERVNDNSKGGLGSQGWERYKNANSGKKRY